MTAALLAAFKRSLRRPLFVFAAVVLLLAAVGLNASVRFMQLHFKKLPVELARPLSTVPDRLGPWVQVSPNQTLDPELQDVLGTDKYIFRDYVDTRIAGTEVASLFKDKSQVERQQLLGRIRQNNPKAVVNLSVTYYTGMMDTVAHVPDRCYVADGYEPKSYDEVDWLIRRPPGSSPLDPPQPVKVRYINFEDQTGVSQVTRSVSYFFKVNDHFECSPLGVRRTMQNLLEKYGYYCKVETMTLINHKEESARVMTEFLSFALPEIEKALPDWEKVKQQSAAK
jgi:hypothetical protein